MRLELRGTISDSISVGGGGGHETLFRNTKHVPPSPYFAVPVIKNILRFEAEILKSASVQKLDVFIIFEKNERNSTRLTEFVISKSYCQLFELILIKIVYS